MKQTTLPSRRQFIAGTGPLALATLAITTVLLSSPAAAQTANWPSRPIRMVVPFPAGSFTDNVARVMADRLSKSLGQPVVVDNKAGANGVIGVTEAAKSAPDGYTLLMTNSSSVTVNPQIYKKLSYKSSDLAPITLVLEAPFILVTNAEWAQKNAIGSVNDLIQYATRNPERLNYGSGGQGNLAHLSYAMLSNRTNIKTTHVPYKSAAQAQLAVLGGDLDTAFDTWTALPHIKTGKLKPLAVTASTRMADLPDVPTMEEAGVAPFDVTFWIGLLAPAGTPPQIVQKIHAVAHEMLGDSKAKTNLSTQGRVVMIEPATFANRIQKEVTEWAGVVQREGIALD